MRLWHKDLIPYLPRRQLLGQWRELCCIAKSIATKGTPNHILVNKIMDYPCSHLNCYALMIMTEMHKRGYICDTEKYLKWCINKSVECDDVFPDWHNDRYLVQCLCNLQEKYDCGGISKDEWMVIASRFDEEMRFCP